MERNVMTDVITLHNTRAIASPANDSEPRERANERTSGSEGASEHNVTNDVITLHTTRAIASPANERTSGRQAASERVSKHNVTIDVITLHNTRTSERADVRQRGSE